MLNISGKNAFFAHSKVAWQQFTGEMSKFITFCCEASSGCFAHKKLLTSADSSFSDYKLMDILLGYMSCALEFWLQSAL